MWLGLAWLDLPKQRHAQVNTEGNRFSLDNRPGSGHELHLGFLCFKPGTCQHSAPAKSSTGLSGRASRRMKIARRIISKHGWYSTVCTDPFFLFLPPSLPSAPPPHPRPSRDAPQIPHPSFTLHPLLRFPGTSRPWFFSLLDSYERPRYDWTSTLWSGLVSCWLTFASTLQCWWPPQRFLWCYWSSGPSLGTSMQG